MTSKSRYPARERFIDAGAYRRRFPTGRPYSQTDDPRNIKPFDETPLGTWRIDDFKGIYGHEIEQLRLVRISDLDLAELDSQRRLTADKRGHDEVYAKWIREGYTPPPIHVVEREDGKLRVIDGHRRVLAYERLGRKRIKAWVSPLAPHPEGAVDAYGKPMFVGLTYEIANQQRTNPALHGKGFRRPLRLFNKKQIRMGLKVEMEHTRRKDVALRIVKDHLSEDPRYYSKLKRAGLADELKKNPLYRTGRYLLKTRERPEGRLNEVHYFLKSHHQPWRRGRQGFGPEWDTIFDLSDRQIARARALRNPRGKTKIVRVRQGKKTLEVRLYKRSP